MSAPQVRIIQRFVNGATNTDILVTWQGRNFGSRVNYPIDNTPASRDAAGAAFLRRMTNQ